MSNPVRRAAQEIVEAFETQNNHFDRIVEVLETVLRRYEDIKPGEVVIDISKKEWMDTARDQKMFVVQTEEGWQIGFKTENGWYPGVTIGEWNPKGLFSLDDNDLMDRDGYPIEEGGS